MIPVITTAKNHVQQEEVSKMIQNLLSSDQKKYESQEVPVMMKSSGIEIINEFKSSNIIDKSMYSEIIGTSNQLNTVQTEHDAMTTVDIVKQIEQDALTTVNIVNNRLPASSNTVSVSNATGLS
jgi:ribosomal protein S5